MSEAPAPVYFVRGDDPSLVAQGVRQLLERLVDGRDPSLVVEEHGGPAAEGLDVGAVVDACTTPPFLVDLRVVVVRDAGRLTAADASRLVALVGDPLPSTALVLAAGGGTVPQALVKAVTAAGQIVDTAVRGGRDRSRWLNERLKEGPVRLSVGAVRRLDDHLGEDLGRLDGLLQSLAAAYGVGARVDEEQLAPFLGEAGAVPPWELTDAIDRGDSARALETLHRMLGPGGRAAPELLAVLHRHISAMLRLDGSDVGTGEEAAQIVGVRSPFVAKKALEQSRRLGTDRIAQATAWLADADLDIKGRSALAPEVVLEVLVARLSRLPRSRVPGRSVAGRR